MVNVNLENYFMVGAFLIVSLLMEVLMNYDAQFWSKNI